MDFDTIPVDDKVYNEDKSLVLIKGIENPKLKGSIFDSNTHEMICSSFTDVEEVEYNPENFKQYFKQENSNTLSLCYEGPLFIVRFDEDRNYHFYNTKKFDCSNSFWGNKDEKFGDLFLKYGGQKFLDQVDKVSGISHHFMIETPSLFTTSRVDFRNNECIIVYLGSVSLDGTILNPSSFPPEIYYYHKIENYNFLPTKEEIQGRILIPSRIDFDGANHILQNGYQSFQLSGKINKHQFIGEPIILRINNRKIIKFLPKCYSIRSFICGNVPNVKNRLYTILEISKELDKYKDLFPVLGSLDKEVIEAIRQTEKSETTKNIETFLESVNSYDEKVIAHRMCNIFLVSILSCPLNKIDLYIDAWFSYLTVKDNIVKFIKEKNAKIRSGNYDDILKQFHNKALERIKNIAKVSKEYATTEKNGHTYISKLEYSIKGLVRNEFGPSLYRIEKAIKYLKNKQNPEPMSVES